MPRKFGWLGTPTTEVALYMFWHTSKIKTIKDAQTNEYVAGAAGAASTPAFYGRVFNQLFNFKARFIVGYPGQNEILHAMESGEVEAMASPFWSSLKASRPTWYPEYKVRFLFQYGGPGPHPELKNVPLGVDLLKDRGRQDTARGGRRATWARPAVRGAARDSRRQARSASRGAARDIQGPGVHCRLRQAAARMRRSKKRRGTERTRLTRLSAPADVRKRLVQMYQVERSSRRHCCLR